MPLCKVSSEEMPRTGLHLEPTLCKGAERRFLHPCIKTGTCPSKAEVLHVQGTKQPAFSMQQSRTWLSPVRQAGDFLPGIPTAIQVS